MDNLTKIACVEDDESIRLIVKLALEDIGGFDVTLFSSGAEAIRGLKAAQPQLIILDVMMPGMDGLETLEKLREFTTLKNTPVIFMTAKAQPNEVNKYLALGAVDVVMKPFNPMTLADRISIIWKNAA